MTTSISLSSPAALVAALPYLLGFEPRDSVILAWLEHRRLLLAQRVDLPDNPGDAGWAAALVAPQAVDRAEAAVVALATDRPDVEELAAAVRQALEAAGVPVLDIVQTWDDRWRSLMCSVEACCPSTGRAVDPVTRDAVAAEFAWAGVAPLPDRQALECALVRDDVRAAAVRWRLPLDVADLETWRDAAIPSTVALLTGEEGRVGLDSAAEAIGALADVRVRDTVLWEAMAWPNERLHRALTMAETLVRSAPRGWLAPVATVYSALAWLAGDGARAGIALERVRDEDPDYSLANLIRTAITAGMPPESWRFALAALTREDCRYGADTPSLT